MHCTTNGYALDFRVDRLCRSLALSVNGEAVDTVDFSPNPPSPSRFTFTPGYTVDLAAGTNTIRLTSIGSSGSAIDYMRIAPLVEPITPSLRIPVRKGEDGPIRSCSARSIGDRTRPSSGRARSGLHGSTWWSCRPAEGRR
ncbi:MAG: hypothetical protein GF331_01050 [Chitinivibrionales bacterium]|nr:hypothetical protein [Chitinivibrionales bacterium]